MKLIQFVVFLCVFSKCLETTEARKSVKTEMFSAEDEEIFEKKHSLLVDTNFENYEYQNYETEENKSFRERDQNSTARPNESRKIRLPDNYNKLEIPKVSNIKFKNSFLETNKEAQELFEQFSGLFPPENGPILVLVDVNVMNIRDIDEYNEEITVELDFIVKWVDPILFFEQANNAKLNNSEPDNITMEIRSLDPIFLNEIWKPDLFIERVVSISRPRLITKPIRLLFSSSGLIILATRVTLKMDCGMEFHYFPADTQSCIFRIRSYSHTTKELNISWDEPGPVLLDRSEHNFDIKLDLMDSTNSVEAKGLVGKSYSETYRILQFKISARRKLSYHLQRTYLCSAWFIITAFLSFLVPATMVESRVAISMTTLLTLVSMFNSIRENTPTVSYTRAIDIWMDACILVVFLSLLELTVLTWRRHLSGHFPPIPEETEKEAKLHVEGNIEQYDLIDSTGKSEHINVRCSKNKLPPLSRASGFLKQFSEQDIEKYSFNSLLLVFIIFNIIYWPWLLISAQYFDWNVDYSYNV